MVFIGLRAFKAEMGAGGAAKTAGIMHFNPHYIKLVDEKKMLLTMDDGTDYRIDDESMQIFLTVMYGDESSLKGDKLREAD